MPIRSNPARDEPTEPALRDILSNAIRYWEPRRIAYNLALAAVVVVWVWTTWPHFRGALSFQHLLALLVLAVLANICYCAGYVVEITIQYSAIQYSAFQATWRRRRWALWLVGTLFAMALAYYWMGGEIYPDIGNP